MTRTQLANEFGVNPKKLKQHCEAHDIKLPSRELLIPKLVQKIRDSWFEI